MSAKVRDDRLAEAKKATDDLAKLIKRAEWEEENYGDALYHAAQHVVALIGDANIAHRRARDAS